MTQPFSRPSRSCRYTWTLCASTTPNYSNSAPSLPIGRSAGTGIGSAHSPTHACWSLCMLVAAPFRVDYSKWPAGSLTKWTPRVRQALEFGTFDAPDRELTRRLQTRRNTSHTDIEFLTYSLTVGFPHHRCGDPEPQVGNGVFHTAPSPWLDRSRQTSIPRALPRRQKVTSHGYEHLRTSFHCALKIDLVARKITIPTAQRSLYASE